MKIRPKKALMLGLAATTLFSTTGCKDNQNGEVYGPPENLLTTESNMIEAVYGPPESFTSETRSEEKTEKKTEPKTERKTEKITVNENDPIDVYGPPEDF